MADSRDHQEVFLGDEEAVNGTPANTRTPRPSGLLFVAVTICCVSPLLFGFALSFTSPTQSTMEGDDEKGVRPPAYLRVFDQSLEIWYASLFNIGAVIGAFSGSAACERYGRRRALLFTALPHLAAWIGTATCRASWLLVVLRLVSGWTVGIGSAVTPVYIAEIAPLQLRGALGAANQLSITLGILLVNVVGGYVFLTESEGHKFCNWRALAVFGAVLSVFLFGIAFMPESPYWLAEHGEFDAAKEALGRLRRGTVFEEFSDIVAEISPPLPNASSGQDVMPPTLSLTEQEEPSAWIKYWEDYRKPLIVASGLLCFQQLSGTNAIMMYTKKICEDANIDNAEMAALVAMGAQVVITAIACFIIESVGRRPLLLLGALSQTLAHALLVYYFFAQSQGWWAPSWMALFALCVFIVGFSLGMGPIPWLMLAEFFPTEARGTASSIATAANWSTSFLVTLVFKPLEDAFSKQGAFFFLALLSLATICFVKVLVPETKGKSPEEVMQNLASRWAVAMRRNRSMTREVH